MHSATRAFTGRELQHRTRPTLGRDPPRTQALNDIQDPEVAIEKQRVDRKAHEGGVDAWRGSQQQTLAGGQAAAAQQASHAAERTIRQLAHTNALSPCEIDYELGLGRPLPVAFSPFANTAA